MDTALIILAAGMGTRMNSDMPKVLHAIAGAPMLVHAMKAGGELAPARTVIVTQAERRIELPLQLELGGWSTEVSVTAATGTGSYATGGIVTGAEAP